MHSLNFISKSFKTLIKKLFIDTLNKQFINQIQFFFFYSRDRKQMQTQEIKQRQRLDPSDNKLQISNKKTANNYFFISKIFFKKFEEIELHALGEATKTAVRVAENLQRQGYATISKINSFTFENQDRKRIKLVVSLKITAQGKERVAKEIGN